MRHARLDQVSGNLWTVPAEHLKGRRGKTAPFRVPLSGEALRVIAAAAPRARDGWLFPGTRRGAISDARMSRTMQRRGMEARPHGLRSSLRTWLAEETAAPREAAETILRHVVGDSVVRACQRSDHLDQRRPLMERWARHCCGTEAAGNRVRIAG